MTQQQLDNKQLKLYYSISEVSNELGVAQSKIRYWTAYFGMSIKRNKKGSRHFKRHDIDLLHRIKKLTDGGLHLWAIAKNWDSLGNELAK